MAQAIAFYTIAAFILGFAVTRAPQPNTICDPVPRS